MIKEFAELMVKRALERGLTLIATTHSDLSLLTIGKLVEQGVLRPRDVKIYYFKRDPWTRASEIRIYEDGTIEGWPDIDKAIAHLF
jgi:predicted ATPase